MIIRNYLLEIRSPSLFTTIFLAKTHDRINKRMRDPSTTISDPPYSDE